MFRAGWLAVAVVAGCLAFPAASLAATFTVNTTADNPPSGSECSGAPGDCSLRQALDKATSGDTVSVPANASAYQVTGTGISIPAGVAIVGGGAAGTTVTGGGTNQVFVVDNSAGSVSISAITLTDGFDPLAGGALDALSGDVTLDQVAITNSSTGDIGGAIETDHGNLTITRSRFTGDNAVFGGAIRYFAGGTLSVSDTEFANDTAENGGDGGAVFTNGPSVFNRVTFDSNSATGDSGNVFGGALDVDHGGSANIENTTFTGNSATNGGGAVSVFSGPATAVNDTFAGNSASTGANVFVYKFGSIIGRFATQNSIFANPQGGGGNCAGVNTTVTDNGNNLEDTSPSTCGFSSASGDIVGQNPQLASAPADNGNTVAAVGGPPQTLALSSTSPALGAASSAGCTTVGGIDERSFPRPDAGDSHCDIGAFELQFHTLSVTVNGSGTVSGTGISCPGTCSNTYPEGTQISLSEQPAASSSFSGWSGDCAGQRGCTVTMNTNQSVTATFIHPATVAASHTLSVSVSGSGTVSGGGISCPGTCAKSYPAGTQVTLQAKPATGYSFAGWSGDCTGKSSCSKTMSSDKSVKATFTRKRLRLAVSPGRARAGSRACFRFTVTSGGTAVRGAKVHFAGKTTTTSRHGRAQICATLPAGVHAARATKPPYRQAVSGVLITRPPHVVFTG